MAQSHGKRSLSLIQSLSIIFVTITLLIVTLSVTTIKGIGKIRAQFDTLANDALPLAMINSKLTQTILEHVKQLSHSQQVETLAELNDVETQINRLADLTNQLVSTVVDKSSQFPQEMSNQQLSALVTNIRNFSAKTDNILQNQHQLVSMQTKINDEVTGFRYGLSSIGPEMNRISSFLTGDNSASADAANRFISSASSMESTFLLLMIQTDLVKAQQQYKEMRNRIAGIQLAFDDFADWHPEIKEFASLIAPYDMVNQGFSKQGILRQILQKLELIEKQRQLNSEAILHANNTIALLNTLSSRAEKIVNGRRNQVTETIHHIALVSIMSSIVSVVLVVISWLALRVWINKGLKNILLSLTHLTQHDLTTRAELKGPYEMKEITNQLNKVVSSTHESITTVTRNCDMLYQTAETSHKAAESSSQSLLLQHQSLNSMVETLAELEQSINKISAVTDESYSDSKLAATLSSQGSCAIRQNQQHLKSLEQSLSLNDLSMEELDNKVKQIREMVDMISGIAESTNLLALNAAIEAARAGEQGRGFAVVADEVRALASDTSQQTSNIKDRMSESVAAAEHSRAAVNHSRAEMSQALKSSESVQVVFSDIEAAVSQIRDRIEQISIATNEQHVATEQVSFAVAQTSEQATKSKRQLESMVESAHHVSSIAGQQQSQLRKYQQTADI